MLAGTSMADCNPGGTWEITPSAGGGTDTIYVECNGTLTGTTEVDVDLQPGGPHCVLTYNISTTPTWDPETCCFSYHWEGWKTCGSFDIKYIEDVSGCIGCDNANGNISWVVEAWLEGTKVGTDAGSDTWTANRISLPEKATNTSPSNGATDQPINVDLSWTNCGACTFDVYFGTDPTPDSGEFKGNQPETTYGPELLSCNTTYYWRIDAKNTNGANEGNVWHFTTGIPDLNGDACIDFVDFTFLASNWMRDDCNVSNEWCDGTDLYLSGNVDYLDLAVLCDNWLNDFSLVGYWKMDDDAASTAVDDDVGVVPHDGVATSNTEDLHVTGKVGTGCFNFNGTDAVEVADHADFTFVEGVDGDFSVAAWVYVTAIGTHQVIISKWEGGAAREWRLKLDTNQYLVLSLYDETNNKEIKATSDDALTHGWHLVVAAYEGEHGSWTVGTAANYITLYVDGAAIDSTATNDASYVKMVDQATKVTVGAQYNVTPVLDSYWADKIDNVMIFDKALSEEEVEALYNQ